MTSDGGIHEFSDSQFGHLFAKGGTRNEAISAMVTALKELKIRGEIRTTVEYVTEMIQDVDFLSQQIHTAWLDRRIAMQVSSIIADWLALNLDLDSSCVQLHCYYRILEQLVGLQPKNYVVILIRVLAWLSFHNVFDYL